MEDKIEAMAFAMFTADTGEASVAAWKAFPNKDRYMRMANAAYWIAISTVEEVHNGPLLQRRANAIAMGPLVDALRSQCSPGEKVIWRCAFRWKDDNGVLSNQYEMFDLESVAANIGCEVVWNFNHAAIVRQTPHDPPMTVHEGE